jgi:Tfp pilus assembly protein PilV
MSRHGRTRPGRRGLTFIEVVACLLLVSIGVLGVIGILQYGTSLADRAQAASTAMATAEAVLADANPLGMADRTVTGTTVTGFLNGYFVRRAATSEALSGGSPLRPVTVTVEVALPSNGEVVATLRSRQLEVVP